MTWSRQTLARLLGRIALAAAIVAGVLFADRIHAAEPSRGVQVGINNTTNETLRNVPVTFGQVFQKGQVARAVAVQIGGKPADAQVDVKRHYDDGSVRFAVVSLLLDEVPPAGRTVVSLGDGDPAATSAAAIAPSDLLKTDFDATLTLRFPDGTVRSASARKLLEEAGAQAKTWLRGPVAAEWLLAGPPVDKDGRPDEDLCVRFEVRAYAGCGWIRVSATVENCWDTWADNIRYDVTLRDAHREVFSQDAVDHRRLSRWRKVFWISPDGGSGEPPLHVVHDLAAMTAAGALPNYDRGLPKVESSQARRTELSMEGPAWGILGNGALTVYMPTTGGRAEIAPYPAWTVRYLLDMEPRAKAVVLAGGDLAGSWPIHVRGRATDRIMTIDERPEFWLDERGKDRPAWKPARHEPGPQSLRLTPDLAHQPSLAYVPYLLTGDYYYLEEAYFWGNYCLLATWPHAASERPGHRGRSDSRRRLGPAEHGRRRVDRRRRSIRKASTSTRRSATTWRIASAACTARRSTTRSAPGASAPPATPGSRTRPIPAG